MAVAGTIDASVIIVSFNTRDMLRECISTLQREAGGVSYETIVVDNGSRDGSADMIASEFPEVRLIRSETNLGFAAANNRAFEVACGRYIVLLNSDAFLRPDALRRSVEHMSANPRAGLGGGQLVGRDGSPQPSARMFPSPLNNLLTMSGFAAKFPGSRLLGRTDQTWADQKSAGQVDWIPGAFSIIRRAVLEKVGFFDERFFFYCEEVDLCRRIKAANYEVWYWPDVEVTHLGGESAKTYETLNPSAAREIELWRMRAGLLYFRKHHGAYGAWSAMLLESWWHRLRAARNVNSNSLERNAKVAASKRLIATMKQAWADTRGGKISPARPW